jgi:hypothetical protein
MPAKAPIPALSPDHARLDRTGAQRSLTTRAKLRPPAGSMTGRETGERAPFMI